MYSDKSVQKASSSEPYSDLGPEPCSVDGPEIPVPGYFRLSQTYAAGKHQEPYCHEPPDQSPTLIQLTAKPQPDSAAAEFADGEKKQRKNPPEADTPRTPIPAASPKSGPLEKVCSPEESASSPELLQSEAKGGSAAQKANVCWGCSGRLQRHKTKNKTQTAL